MIVFIRIIMVMVIVCVCCRKMVLCIVNLLMNTLLVFMVMRFNPAGAISLYTLFMAPIIFVVVLLMNVVFLVMIHVI